MIHVSNAVIATLNRAGYHTLSALHNKHKNSHMSIHQVMSNAFINKSKASFIISTTLKHTFIHTNTCPGFINHRDSHSIQVTPYNYSTLSELPSYQMQGTIMQNSVWVHPFINIIPITKYKATICHFIDNETSVYTYTTYMELDSFQK